MNYTKEQCDLIIVDSFEELNYKQKQKFLRSVDEKQNEHIKYCNTLIKSTGDGVYNKLKAMFSDGQYRSRILSQYEQKDVVCIPQNSPLYPALLLNTPAPPLVLYCKGNINLLAQPCFGVVGSRKTPISTLAVARQMSGKIASRFVVVTGIASGADSAAIEGALPTGRIICVLPGGYDHLASSDGGNIRRVAERGLVISEWPPQTSALRYMFSVRNRVIAGLSRGVLVVAAPQKSGALITAGYAADYGREVFAFPHSIGVKSGEGSNALINNGAYLCQNILDIFSVFGLEYKTEQKQLTREEERVLSYLREKGQTHIQKLARELNIMVYQAVTTLSALEIKGCVSRCGGNTYSALE